MAEEQIYRQRRGQLAYGARRRQALLALLRRAVAPRPPAVLVMEPDGRLRRQQIPLASPKPAATPCDC